jgi:hypothetical protein
MVFFNHEPCHESVLGVEVSSTHSLTSALDGGEWSALCSSHFTPREKSSWYPLDRRLGGPQSHSECGSEEKIFQLTQVKGADSNLIQIKCVLWPEADNGDSIRDQTPRSYTPKVTNITVYYVES